MSAMDSATASYPRRFPAALLARPRDQDLDCAATQFHAYSIKFGLLEIGGDLLQGRPATDFLLLAPAALDEEVGSATLQLHLQLRGLAEARIRFFGLVSLSAEELECAKQFNLWLFIVILGRHSDARHTGDYDDGPKGYYVLPLSSSAGGIDWTTVNGALSSALDGRRKSQHCAAVQPALDCADCDANSEGEVEEGHLRMWNGNFSKESLADGMVTCALNGMVFYVVQISDSDGWSLFPLKNSSDSMSYSEYYDKKYRYKLRDKHQPLLSGRRLLSAASYLRCQTSSVEFSGCVFGGSFSKQMEIVEMPPEICILHVGLQARLLRGAMRLPTVLYSLEKALVAAELRDLIGVSMSSFKVLQALTSESCQGDKSYESFELLGDSVLKIAGALCVFVQDSCMNFDDLGNALHDVVSNRTLYQHALARGLPEFVFTEIFTPRCWMPPGPLLLESRQRGSLEATQRLSFKTIADVAEALVGAYLIEGQFEGAMQVMSWLGLPICYPPPIAQALGQFHSCKLSGKVLPQFTDVFKLQSKLGYWFKNLDHLAAALHYISAEPERVSMFQRLEFLGDAVLHFLVTRHFVHSHPDLAPGRLNDLKQATVNSENYACVVVRNGLHRHLQEVSPVLKDEIVGYVLDFSQEDGASKWNSFGLASQTSPKVVGDVLQTVAAAVFLDSGFDVELVWKVFRPFLEPLATPDTVILQPVRQLQKVCREQNLRLDMRCVSLSGMVVVQAVINDVPLGTSQHEEKRVARRLAAAKVGIATSWKWLEDDWEPNSLSSHPVTRNLEQFFDGAGCQHCLSSPRKRESLVGNCCNSCRDIFAIRQPFTAAVKHEIESLATWGHLLTHEPEDPGDAFATKPGKVSTSSTMELSRGQGYMPTRKKGRCISGCSFLSLPHQ